MLPEPAVCGWQRCLFCYQALQWHSTLWPVMSSQAPRVNPLLLFCCMDVVSGLPSKFISLYPQVSSALRSHQKSFCVLWMVVSEKGPHISKTTRQFMWCYQGTISRLLMWSLLGGNTMNEVTDIMSQTWLCRWCRSLFQHVCNENTLCLWHVLTGAEKTGQQATSLALEV